LLIKNKQPFQAIDINRVSFIFRAHNTVFSQILKGNSSCYENILGVCQT